jgi:hypothetical protein
LGLGTWFPTWLRHKSRKTWNPKNQKTQQSKTPEALAAFLPLDMILLCAVDKIPVAKI